MVNQGKKYYFISGADCSSIFVFELKNNPQKQCGKPTYIYHTKFHSLYMDRLGKSSDMDTEKNLLRDQNGATKSYIFWDQWRKWLRSTLRP